MNCVRAYIIVAILLISAGAVFMYLDGDAGRSIFGMVVSLAVFACLVPMIGAMRN